MTEPTLPQCAECNKLKESLERMRGFIEFYAYCPCCEESEVCLDGCTFSVDSPVGYDVMQDAREALK